jgi:hypothetical protein
MQSPFGSVSLLAEAYERELRADAARVRPVKIGNAGEATEGTTPGRIRRAIGSGLVRAGQRLQGAGSLGTGGEAAVRSIP